MTDSGRMTSFSRSRVLTVTVGGSILEYYDYALYSIAAAMVLNTQFFPQVSPAIGTIASLATFATGVMMKPFGALVFAHFGDKVGRARVLFMTMVLLGVSTIAIGLLPTYDTIGLWAPAGLIFLRLVQGFAAGAEMPGSAIFGLEAAPEGKRGLYASFTSFGSGIGATLALLAFMLTSSLLGPDDLREWGWRIPFLSSAAILVFVYFARRGIVAAEKSEFQAKTEIVKVPIREALARYKTAFLGVIGVVAGYMACSGLGAVYFLTYMSQNGYSDNETFTAQLIFQILIIPLVPLVAVLSDRTNRRTVLILGAVATAVFFTVFFTVVPNGNPATAYIISALVAASVSLMYGGLLAFASEQFPRRVRYSGMGVAFSIGGAIGGLSPVLAATVFELSHQSAWAMSALGVGICVVVAGSTLVLRNHAKSTHQSLEDEGDQSAASDPSAPKTSDLNRF